MLSSPPIHQDRDCHTLAKTACISLVLKHMGGGRNSFYYWECHLRQEKTLTIEQMDPVKGIQIELEAKVITLWLVNCHPPRLSYQPQELEVRQPTPRRVNKPSNTRLETLGRMSSLRTQPLLPILRMKSPECPSYGAVATPHRNDSCCFVLCVCCCHWPDHYTCAEGRLPSRPCSRTARPTCSLQPAGIFSSRSACILPFTVILLFLLSFKKKRTLHS